LDALNFGSPALLAEYLSSLRAMRKYEPKKKIFCKVFTTNIKMRMFLSVVSEPREHSP
jgi:hypothetical protein